MQKKEIIAMLLAGGQSSPLGVLTEKTAKPALSFGGRYRIIDFPLSNCTNSGIDTVGVLTQYQPLRLNSHIGSGIPWDLDRNHGGVTILPPRETVNGSDFYSGTADAVRQNLDYIEQYDPDYVLILPGDHVCKMDYQAMLEQHKASRAELTVACARVPAEKAPRFGQALTDGTGRIRCFVRDPEQKLTDLVSLGTYIFSWPVLRQELTRRNGLPCPDFERQVIPAMAEEGRRIFSWVFRDYWTDAETLEEYWKANLELTRKTPAFDLYEEFWKIYTREDQIRPQYLGPESSVTGSLAGSGCRIYGKAEGSVLGADVLIEEGAEVTDSVLMTGVRIGKGAKLNRCIIAEGSVIGDGAVLGKDGEAPAGEPERNGTLLVTVAENSLIPAGVCVERGTSVSGKTCLGDYPGGRLSAGSSLIRKSEIL